MKKKLPYIIGAFIVVIGAALWFSQKPEEEPVALETSPIATSSMPAFAPGSSAAAAPTSVPAGMPALPTGVAVTNQTLVKTYNNPSWALSFTYMPEWKQDNVTNEKGEATQVHLSSDGGTFLISKDLSIAQPSLVKYTTSTRTIAGQSVEVRTYTSPNDKYAYYLYFTIVAGGDDYHFSLKSYEASKEETDTFIKRIKVK